MAFKDGLYADRAELSFDYPSQCADNLASGRADVGLISSIEYQRIPGLKIAPHIAIASHREVRSVVIVTRKELGDIETVALDRFSRSSVALLRILLHRRHGLRPRFVTMTPDPERMLAVADAALIIGDAALGLAPGPYRIIDLASQWFAETGLPFVFAFWAMRATCPTREISELLLAAKNYGLENISRRMADIQARWPLPEADILEYFQTNIHYDLDSLELQSLDLFYSYAREAGLISEVLKPVFA